MSEAPATTVDAFLGGRVEALQPTGGQHRSGLDAVLLAAALGAATEGEVADLGAGAGVAGFCVAARCPAARVVLVEREPELAALARAALQRPANAGFAPRLRIVTTDIAATEAAKAAAGLARESAAAVIANPPFHEAGKVRASPVEGRAAAHVLGPEGLAPWFRAGAALLQPGGLFVAILHAGALAAALELTAGRFGDVHVLPIHPRTDRVATRILVAGRKGSRGAGAVLPGLVLHGAGGNRFTPEVERMLRDGAALAEVHPAWQAVSGSPS